MKYVSQITTIRLKIVLNLNSNMEALILLTHCGWHSNKLYVRHYQIKWSSNPYTDKKIVIGKKVGS